ncbi:hypothetical protein ACIRPQ_34200 [Streptomyces sp. NPDC101213]|uniref:hypothetical protein n=1 Tax=Streptomyces sp. NPDC101213 TaxID=3366130 RepID=UPI00380AC6FB
MTGPKQGIERARWAAFALALCAVGLVITLIWVEIRALALWVLLAIALLSIQQLLLGLWEAKRKPTQDEKPPA